MTENTGERSRSCKSCRHSNVSAEGENVSISCRRYPPTVMYVPIPQKSLVGGPPNVGWMTASGFPTVLDSMWCGEWQAGRLTAVANQPTIK